MTLARNLIFGALAGTAATYLMTQFQNRSQGNRNEGEKEGPEAGKKEEPATTIVAERIYSKVRHSELPDDKKESAGQLVHYTFGAVMGAGFGILADALPQNPISRGLLYGSMVWLFADEIGNAVAKLSPPPWKVDSATHAYAWFSHLIYGAALSGIYIAENKIAA
jgi:hypothetical protein